MTASAYHVISKEVENHIFRYNEFLDTDVCVNNPLRQISGIIIFLSKYDIAISDTLVSSFLDVFFFLIPAILPEAS